MFLRFFQVENAKQAYKINNVIQIKLNTPIVSSGCFTLILAIAKLNSIVIKINSWINKSTFKKVIKQFFIIIFR